MHPYNSFAFQYFFQLSTDVVTFLEDYKGQRVEAYTFEMYTIFQQFVELSQHIEKESVSLHNIA